MKVLVVVLCCVAAALADDDAFTQHGVVPDVIDAAPAAKIEASHRAVLENRRRVSE